MDVFRMLLFVFVTMCSVTGERILAVFPFIGQSHFFAFEPVLVELAKRGHEMTVISQFPRANKMDRYTDISFKNLLGKEIMANLQDGGLFNSNMTKQIFEVVENFEKVFKDKRMQDLINTTKFDLVMTELFISDMFVGLAHKLQTPLVEMTSSAVLPWSTDRFAIPDNPSYVRTSVDRGSGPMTFFDRITSCIKLILLKTFYSYFITPNDEIVSKKYLGADTPHVKEIMENTSLLLVNSHFSVNGARPFPPQVVEIGGIHIKPAKPLPQDIEKFINESEHGVVYFSLGSVANGSSMSDSMRNAFCESFAKLKQRVLWKWELDEMPGKPDNVKILKWMPQRDILAHPNIRVFIGHGGQLSTLEAVYNAVPMIGIPVFGDQYQNIINLVNAWTAELLDLSTITEEIVSMKLNALINDPKYKMNAQRLSKLFKDRPASPMDTAIYWIEYVMKHKGAHHLRTPAVGLPWYQYLLLDVIGAFILVFIFVISVLIYVIKLVLRKVCRPIKKKDKTH